MELAVIKTGGKQYLVSPGKKIKIEKLNAREGEELIFNEVLLLAYNSSNEENNYKVAIGEPLVKNAKVIGKVLKQGKDKKVVVFKYKPKKRYRVKKGHRQLFTEVEITKIETK